MSVLAANPDSVSEDARSHLACLSFVGRLRHSTPHLPHTLLLQTVLQLVAATEVLPVPEFI